MGAASLHRFLLGRQVSARTAAVWAALFVVLVLLAYIAVLSVMSTDGSGVDDQLFAPFRWLPPEGDAVA